MRDTYRLVPLAELCEVFTDGNWVQTKDQSPSGVRLIQTGNVGTGVFKNRLSKARFVSEKTFQDMKCAEVLPGDCLISRLPDPVGRACIVPNLEGRIITAVDCSIVRFNEDQVFPAYFNYYAQSSNYFSEVEAYCTGATRKRISRKNLGKVQVPVPSLSEQKRIVAILDEAFSGIETAIANTEKNLANARELFESYLNLMFSDQSEEWDATELRDVCRLINGRAYKKSELLESGPYPVLRVGNFFTNQSWYYSDLELDEDKYCENGDLLYAWSASFGPRVWEGGKVIFHYHIWKVELDNSQIDKKFLYYWFEWDKEKIKKGQGAGTTMIHVTKGAMEQRKLLLPSIPEQKHIADILDDLRAEASRLESIYQQKLTALSEFKQSLLQKAFSGELTADRGEHEVDSATA